MRQQLAPRVISPLWIASFPCPSAGVHANRVSINRAEIAKRLARASGLPIAHHSLLRTRDNGAGRPAAQGTAQQCAGAFECRNRFSGKRLLLIDDVMTTAATANECARARAETAQRPRSQQWRHSRQTLKS